MKFFRVTDPTDNDIAVLVKRIRDRVVRYLTKKGYEISDFSEDPFAFGNGGACRGLDSKSHWSGRTGGQKVRRVGTNGSIGEVYRIRKRCAVCDGFSPLANVKIEKLCRYTARPTVALERLSETGDGKILYRLKTQYSDGTTHVLFDPLELVEKVVALIPPPRANLLRYHGVFAPNSKDRKRIRPGLARTPVNFPNLHRMATSVAILRIQKFLYRRPKIYAPNCLIVSHRDKALAAVNSMGTQFALIFLKLPFGCH